jgi:predicted nucleic acid-binding protein
VILDTNALSALADGDEGLLAAAAGVSVLHLPVVVLGEYRFGVARSRHKERYVRWLASLVAVSRVLEIDDSTASHYAAIREELRARGRPIPSNDAWIAALARQHALPVLTRDEHFDEVGRLRRIAW